MLRDYNITDNNFLQLKNVHNILSNKFLFWAFVTLAAESIILHFCFSIVVDSEYLRNKESEYRHTLRQKGAAEFWKALPSGLPRIVEKGEMGTFVSSGQQVMYDESERDSGPRKTREGAQGDVEMK